MSRVGLVRSTLDIPPGPLSRAKAIKIDCSGLAASDLAARILLIDGGAPDAQAVAHVVLAGPGPLAALAAARFSMLEDDAAEAIASTAAELIPTSRLTVAMAIALRCHQLGMGKAFAYPGTSELAVCFAFAQLGDGALVNARGDGQSVFMAGGGALASRQLQAVAVVHGARGLTNAAGAIGVLRRNELPALIIVGLPSTASADFLPPHGEDRLLAAVGEFAKASHEVEWPARAARSDVDAVALVDRAWELATALPRGPVLLGIPQDIIEARVVPAGNLARPCPSVAPLEVNQRHLRRARSLVCAAERPVILFDDYLLVDEAATAAAALLAEQTGAPMFQLRYRRGPMLFSQLTQGRIANFAGSYDPIDPVHRERMRSADLLITVEDRNMYPRVVGELPPCPKIAITSDPSTTRRNAYLQRSDLLLAGEPKRILEALLPSTSVLGGEGTRRRQATDRRSGPSSARGELALSLSRLVRGCLAITGASYVVDDSQIAGGLLASHYEDTFEDAAVFGDHGGFVGAGIPLATGLAVTHDAPVICLLGDQGFTNGAQGLVSAGQELAPVLYIVANNGESVSLRTEAARLGDPPSDFDRLLRNAPNYAYLQAAAATSIPAAVLDLELRPLTGPNLDEALAVVSGVWSPRGPALVELLLPGPGPAWEGVWATRGLDEVASTPSRGNRP